MSDGVKIPDGVPERLWRPPPPLALSHEEWRAFGVVVPLVLNRLLREPEPVTIEALIQTMMASKTFAMLWLTEPKRCGVLMSVVACFLESGGLVTAKPSVIGRSENMAVPVIKTLLSVGPGMKAVGAIEVYRAFTLPFVASAIGELAPGVTRTLFSAPPAV